METDVLVIGGGPAGLSAAITARELGIQQVLVVDENPLPGGQLIKQTHKFFGSRHHFCGVRGIDIAVLLLSRLKQGLQPTQCEARDNGIEILLNASAVGIYDYSRSGDLSHNGKIVSIATESELIQVHCKRIIVSTGAQENMLNFSNNDLPGIYGAGAVQTLVNVYGVPPGKKVLMVGSGNIGLIVSYQLMQAGIQVVGIIEALNKIGGYLVHAAKVRRLGIPIYISHTIKEAIGEKYVEAAVIVELNAQWNEISGTEQKIECDVICLACGLSPSTELLHQAGCKMVYTPEMGGYVAWHNERLQTSIDSIYVAGDSSGIEEAVTAILEGRIAGASCVYDILGSRAGRVTDSPLQAETIIQQSIDELHQFRSGPFGEKTVKGKKKMTNLLS
ncbi:MAG: FAD-dependent oxidoreductase [Candidatus Stahlbacteria bacterium]|nr:FAD-dependent oxidoreductase [Candidatus Stahlbacteria bacterium]